MSQMEKWLKKVTKEWFSPFMGGNVQPKDVYVGATVDQGGNLLKAIKMCEVPSIKCFMHRLNTCVQWATGLAGTPPKDGEPGTVKNAPMKDLISRGGAVVNHFAHSSVANDALYDIQDKLFEAVDAESGQPLNVVKRNDTRLAYDIMHCGSASPSIMICFVTVWLELLAD
jgi:hypothetical protein